MSGRRRVPVPETVAPDRPRNAPGSRPAAGGRRYPRGQHEAGADLEAVGERRAATISRLGYLYAGLRDLEDEAVSDLGGEPNVAALRREVLAIGLQAEGIAIALIAEIGDKMRLSREAGRTPHISRYRATHCVATFLDLAARRYREVGLERRARAVGSYIEEVLAHEDGRRGANSDEAGPTSRGPDDGAPSADVGVPGADPAPGVETEGAT